MRCFLYLVLDFYSELALDDGKKLFRDYGIAAQNLVELGALAWLADPAGIKERSTTKRKIISLVKVSFFIFVFVDTSLLRYTKHKNN